MNSNRQGARSCLIAMMLTMLAAVVVPAQAQTYAVAFPAPTTFASASNPTFSTVAVATGDFNGMASWMSSTLIALPTST